MKTLGDRLNHLMGTKKVSNARMARLCGVSRQSVIHWRKPKFKRLDASVALTICAEYSVNMRWLVLGEGEMAAQSTLAFDSKRLASAIQLLETHLQDSGARLSTEKKARAIAIIYELLSGVVPDASEPSVIKNVLRLVA